MQGRDHNVDATGYFRARSRDPGLTGAEARFLGYEKGVFAGRKLLRLELHFPISRARDWTRIRQDSHAKGSETWLEL